MIYFHVVYNGIGYISSMKSIATLFLAAILLLVNCFSATGQSTTQFDSLIVLQKATQDNQPKTSLKYAKAALQLAESSQSPTKRLIAYNAMTKTHIDLGNYVLALGYTDKALKLSILVADSSALASVYADKSLIYDQLGDYPKALENSYKSVEIFAAINDHEGLAYCYNDIGVIHYYRADQELALTYFQRSFDEFEALHDSVGMGLFFNNTANVYSDNGEYDKALKYYWQGYVFDLHLKDRAGQTVTLSNIGETYTAMGQYEKAEDKLMESLTIAEQDEDPWAMSNPLRALGELYRMKKEYGRALEMITRGFKLADSINATAEVSLAYFIFSEIHESMGNHKKALEYLRLHKSIEDSLFNANNTRSITEMETRFQTKEKETEIVLQQLEIDQRRNANYLLGLGLSLALVMAGFVGLAYRQKKRSNFLLAEKNVIIEEKNRDITDSIEYARTIQESMLPSITAIQSAFLDSFVMFRPKDIVSGDFYWFQKHTKGNYIAAVDCIGHGVPGAMVSMLGNDLLHQAINKGSCVTPGEVLTHLNKAVIANFNKEGKRTLHNGMDIALCRFSPSGGLEFAGAKNPLFLIREGELLQYKADRVSIGGSTPEDHAFMTHKIELKKGDACYLFSDGFSDQFGGPKGKKFNIRNFKQVLMDNQDKTMAEQQTVLEKSLEEWKGDIEQIDDVCIIGIKV